MMPEWEQNDIVVNGAQLHYYRTPGTKDSGKPVLVLQHGFSDNGLCWAPVAAELAGAYDIVMPDARGHGLSARVARGEAVDQAADLAGLMQALGIERAVVAGHSMGAQIAALLAARYPQLVTRAVLEDPPWWAADPNAPRPARIFTEDSPTAVWLRGLQAQTFEAAVAQCRAEHPSWPDMYLHPWVAGKQQLDLTFLSAEMGGFGAWNEIVAAIQCPTLLITADPAEGGIVTPNLAEQIVRENACFQTAHFPGIGHHVRFAVHEEYMKVFRAFLNPLE